jgi:peptidoglycan/LPS O-acetylase OafA/YrhL
MKLVLSACLASWIALIVIDVSKCLGFISDPMWSSWLQNDPLLWASLFFAGVVACRLVSEQGPLSVLKSNGYSLGAIATIVLLSMFCPDRFSVLLIDGGVMPLFILLVWSTVCTQAVLNKVLGSAAFLSLGRISYIMYIVQAPVWHFFRMGRWLVSGHLEPAGLLSKTSFLVYLGVLIGISFAAERWIEIPMQRMLGSRLLRPAPPISHTVDNAREVVPQSAQSRCVRA